ncbi:MAG: HEAT repeat domain-containing protein [Anaerolineales bacterium]
MAALEQLLSDLKSGDEDRAEAAIPALDVHGPQTIQALQQLLQSPITDHRWWAARALAEFPIDDARSALIRALDDPAGEVRQCAALALQHNPSPNAITPLIGALDAEDRLFARLAGDALSAIGADAVPALAEAAQHAEGRVRIEAVRALADMRQAEAIGPLFKAIDDPSSMVQHWAEQGLDALGIGMSFFKP